MPVTASFTAIFLATTLGLSADQSPQPERRIAAIQILDNGITYRASRNNRLTGTRPEVGLKCAGRNIRFTLSGLPLSGERNQDIQMTIGDWSRPLYRAELSQDWAESVTSPALLNAIRSNSSMTVKIDGRDYRLRPQMRDQHIDFAQMCALAVDASVGNHPPQSVIIDPDVEP